jgi:hypothetical protein
MESARTAVKSTLLVNRLGSGVPTRPHHRRPAGRPRDHVIGPILASVRSPDWGHKAASGPLSTATSRPCASACSPFADLGLTTSSAAAEEHYVDPIPQAPRALVEPRTARFWTASRILALAHRYHQVDCVARPPRQLHGLHCTGPVNGRQSRRPGAGTSPWLLVGIVSVGQDLCLMRRSPTGSRRGRRAGTPHPSSPPSLPRP